MPWIIPSHQAPALLLKRWRPGWFSGLGLTLGSLAPDLEFIVPLRRGTMISHTLLGQVVFTVPVAIILYLLTSDLVWPWLAPNLPWPSPNLAAVRRPRGFEWWRVGISALIGGVTHIALDGFTHPASDGGWAVALFPPLGWHAPFRFASVPLYDILQGVLSVVLAVIAWRVGQGFLWDGPLRAEKGPRSNLPPVATLIPIVRGLAACAGLGALAAVVLRPEAPPDALEFAAYGALDGIALGMLVAAATWRRQRSLRRRVGAIVVPAA